MKRKRFDHFPDLRSRPRVEDWDAVLSQDNVEEEVWDLFYLNFDEVKLTLGTRQNIIRLAWIKDDLHLLRRMEPVGDETEIICLHPFPSRILTAVMTGDEYPDCPYNLDVISSKVIDTRDTRKLRMFMKLSDTALISIWTKCCRHPTIIRILLEIADNSCKSRFLCYRLFSIFSNSCLDDPCICYRFWKRLVKKFDLKCEARITSDVLHSLWNAPHHETAKRLTEMWGYKLDDYLLEKQVGKTRPE